MTPLPRSIVWLLRQVVPSTRAETVIADLQDDYDRAARRRDARLWLWRETISLLISYAVAPWQRPGRLRPMWTRDLHLVLRSMRRGPIATLGAAAMLSAGLLAVLLTAGLIQALLFRPVSARFGDELRRVTAVDRQGRSATRLSFVELQIIRDHLDGAADFTAVYLQPVVLRASGTDIQTMAEIVDGHYFFHTGTGTLIGRGLLTTDDRESAPPVAVIAEPLWRRQFSASPAVLGSTIAMNGAAYTVVGVAASLGSSSFLGASVDAWVPIAHADPLIDRGWRTDVTERWFSAFVLPRGGVAEVEVRLAAARDHLARLHPDPWQHRRLQTAPGTVLSGSQRQSMAMLAGVLTMLALLILAAAGSNLSGVLLARAAAGRRAAAIHLCIGSGRAVILRRQVMEGALFGVLGGILAVGMYAWARTWLEEITILPTLSLRLMLPFTPGLLASTIVAGALAGAALALGPALWSMRVDLMGALRDSDSRASGGMGLTRLRAVLVSTQLALSLALITVAALFAQTLGSLTNADLGFARERLIAMDFDVEPSGPAAADLPGLAREALKRVEALPGVAAAAMSNRAPVDQSTPLLNVGRPGDRTAAVEATMYLATAGYFETVGINLVAGRAFTRSEEETAADVAIVNEALARRLWPDDEALNRGLELRDEQRIVRVVGVARDSKYRALTESEQPHLYRPTAPAFGRTLLVRSSGDRRDALQAVQRALDTVGPGLMGFFPRTLDDHLAIQLLPTRAAAGAATGLGGLALALSAVGLYGLVSWFVELRRREIGVRMALGASAASVRRLVVRQALKAAAPGVVCGVGLAIGLGTLARSALFGVGPADPFALGVGAGTLLVVVLLAGYLPSRRATTVDPAAVLRT